MEINLLYITFSMLFGKTHEQGFWSTILHVASISFLFSGFTFIILNMSGKIPNSRNASQIWTHALLRNILFFTIISDISSMPAENFPKNSLSLRFWSLLQGKWNAISLQLFISCDVCQCDFIVSFYYEFLYFQKK